MCGKNVTKVMINKASGIRQIVIARGWQAIRLGGQKAWKLKSLQAFQLPSFKPI